MDGPIPSDDVYKDLRRVFADIDPSTDPLHIGTAIRERARQRVQEGIERGVLVSWADVHELIQEQDDEDLPLEEGQEAWDVVVDDDDGDDADDDDDSDGNGDDGRLSAKAAAASGEVPCVRAGESVHGHGTVHEGAVMADADRELPASAQGPTEPLPDELHLFGDFEDEQLLPAEEGTMSSGALLSTDAAQPPASSSSSFSAPSSGKAADASCIRSAREILYHEALRTRNDLLARTLRKEMAQESKKRKAADTPEGLLLREAWRTSKEQEERRRADLREEERAAQLDLESKRRQTAEAKAAEHLAKRLAIETAIRDRQRCSADRLRIRSELIYSRWMQGHFAASVANRLLGMGAPARSHLSDVMSLAARSNWFLRPLQMVHLWDDDDQNCISYGMLKPPGGGHTRHRVRCSLSLEAILLAPTPRAHALPREARDAALDLFNLFVRCVPKASLPFSQLHTPLKLLHHNHYDLDKAFLYGIIALSKWLGELHFPLGIYGSWPPSPPDDVKASMDSVLGLHASSGSAASSGGTGAG